MNNYQMDAILYDPQQNFSKYLEINKYVIPGGYLHNPLITLNPLRRPDIMMPDINFTNENYGLCTQLISGNYHKMDKKPVNCLKMFSNSRKLIYGTMGIYMSVIYIVIFQFQLIVN